MTKRLSKIVKRSFKIKSTHEELGEVLAKLIRMLDIDELHIMTYKDRIDLFATKEMNPLHVELYEKLFSLSEDDVDRIEDWHLISCIILSFFYVFSCFATNSSP